MFLLGLVEGVAEASPPDLYLGSYLAAGRSALWRFAADREGRTSWKLPARGHGIDRAGPRRHGAVEAAWSLLDVVRRYSEAPPRQGSPWEWTSDSLQRALLLFGRAVHQRACAVDSVDAQDQDPLASIVEVGAWAEQAAWGLRTDDPRSVAREALVTLAAGPVSAGRASLRRVRPALDHRPPSLAGLHPLRDDSWSVLSAAVDSALELTRNGRRPRPRARKRWRPTWQTRWHELGVLVATSSCAPLWVLRRSLAQVAES